MDHPTRHITSSPTHYDPGAAWNNRGMWLGPSDRVILSLAYTPRLGWHYGSASLQGEVGGLEVPDLRKYRIESSLTTDLFLAVTTTLYLSADEWASPRLFPL